LRIILNVTFVFLVRSKVFRRRPLQRRRDLHSSPVEPASIIIDFRTRIDVYFQNKDFFYLLSFIMIVNALFDCSKPKPFDFASRLNRGTLGCTVFGRSAMPTIRPHIFHLTPQAQYSVPLTPDAGPVPPSLSVASTSQPNGPSHAKTAIHVQSRSAPPQQ
jgi:hypothetical protein